MKKKISGIMLFAALFASASVQASDNLLFKGNLIIPNCTINNGVPVETDFGDIEIQSIANINTAYKWTELHIPMNCPYNLKTPKIKITGARGWASNSLQTSKFNDEKVVVYFRQVNNKGPIINLNDFRELGADAITGSGASKTLNIAVGVGREGDMELLTPGPFTASANMEVRYE